jgi:hypothetical protein
MRYLVVANHCLSNPAVTSAIVDVGWASPGCRVHLVVPATPAGTASDDPDGDARTAAHDQLLWAVSWLRHLGVDVDGEVGDPSPIVAAADALRRDHYDQILVATRPLGQSRWLKMGVPRRLHLFFQIPVHHIVGFPIGAQPAWDD